MKKISYPFFPDLHPTPCGVLKMQFFKDVTLCLICMVYTHQKLKHAKKTEFCLLSSQSRELVILFFYILKYISYHFDDYFWRQVLTSA